MEYKQIMISRFLVKSCNDDEIKMLKEMGYQRGGENYYGDYIFDKNIETFVSEKYYYETCERCGQKKHVGDFCNKTGGCGLCSVCCSCKNETKKMKKSVI